MSKVKNVLVTGGGITTRTRSKKNKQEPALAPKPRNAKKGLRNPPEVTLLEKRAETEARNKSLIELRKQADARRRKKATSEANKKAVPADGSASPSTVERSASPSTVERSASPGTSRAVRAIFFFLFIE